MSAQPFLHGLTDGLMFGMLTSTPLYGGFYPSFYSPMFNPVSMFMPFYGYSSYYPLMPQNNSMPMLYNFNMPDFTANQFQMNSEFDWMLPSAQNQGLMFNAANYTFTTPSTQAAVAPSASTTSTNSSSDSSTNKTSSSSSSADSSSGYYSGTNSDVTKPYTGSVDALNRKLANKGVLRGKGAKFMEMQEKYGISASFLAAICIHESGGTSAQATDSRNLHNVAGITTRGGSGWKKYASVDDCIEDLARLLKNSYVDKGLTTISQIHQKYCPPKGDKKDKTGINGVWGSKVTEIKNGIDTAIA